MKARLLRSGLAEIRNAVGRMTVLADWMEIFRPACTVMTLWHKDFEAICRNPDIAARFQIVVPPSGRPRWRQYELTTVGAGSSQPAGLRHFDGAVRMNPWLRELVRTLAAVAVEEARSREGGGQQAAASSDRDSLTPTMGQGSVVGRTKNHAPAKTSRSGTKAEGAQE